MKKSATFNEEDALFLPHKKTFFRFRKRAPCREKFKNIDFSIAQFFHYLAFISPLCITDGKINQSCWTCGGLYMT